MTTVLIVAVAEVERAGLEALIRGSRTLELAGSLSEAQELPQALDEIDPGVVVFAVNGKTDHESSTELVLSAWRAASLASAGLGGPALVVLTEEFEPGQMADAVRAGWFALLPLDSSAHEIRAAIEAAVAGLVALHPSFTDAAAARRAAPTPPRAPGTSLTAREVEVLRLIAAGLANKEIAGRLEISDHTVKFHIASIFNKLDVSNRAEAVSSGMRLGLIMV
ncbi:MAG: LuxR C-terminal-related transcriptional regulator [Terriglobia bacterium]